MTLVIAAKGNDHILVGADSRAVQKRGGTRILSDNIHEKLIKLNDFNYVLIAGEAGKAVYLIESFKKIKIKKNEDINSLLNRFKEHCRKDFLELMKMIKIDSKYFPEIAFILVGFENKNSKPTKSRII